MRCDGAIASVYDESGLEIENLEVLYTEEGMYALSSWFVQSCILYPYMC